MARAITTTPACVGTRRAHAKLKFVCVRSDMNMNANILKGSRNSKSSAVDTLVRKRGVEYTTISITITINKRSSAVRADGHLTLSPKG